MLALQGVNILPQFLTFMLLSFIYFQVFLSQLFDRKKLQKLPAHGLSKSFTPLLTSLIDNTALSHPVRCKLRLHYARLYAGGIVDLQANSSFVAPSPLVSAVPISGTKELASRTPRIVWHTRSDTFVLIPLLELTRAVAQTVPVFFLTLPFVRDLLYKQNKILSLFRKEGHCG